MQNVLEAGSTTEVRCFTGEKSDEYVYGAYYNGDLNYMINYEGTIATCQANEVRTLQVRFTVDRDSVSGVEVTRC